MKEDMKAMEFVSGSRRLRPEEIEFEHEMLIIGNRLNFYMSVYFDPIEIFGWRMAKAISMYMPTTIWTTDVSAIPWKL